MKNKRFYLMLVCAIMAIGAAFAQSDDEILASMKLKEGQPAPDFCLKDLEGNDVTLTYYQGDWVVLDFWGSWCRYCVQGIPEMKKAYEAYHPMGFEIIGIDCNEAESAWKEAVAKYQLPWVNVYNPGDRNSGVCAEYDIKGYPTKIVVNPEGYVYKIFIGEDPAFYEFLKSLFQ